MANSYKSLKEDFVSNLTGGSIGEINVVTCVAPAAVLFWSAVQARHGLFEADTIPAFAADFLLNICSILLVSTIYSSQALSFLMIILCSSLFYALTPSTAAATKVAKRPSKKEESSKDDLGAFPIRPFITAYRGCMLVITCSSILAVDFAVFPRRFAKVETWGTSLMDLGVGSFVFSAGVVAAKGPVKDQMLSSMSKGYKKRTVGGRAFTAVRQALPLFVLGLVRLVSVKNLDYAEHVSEFGVHWNFFFTLALIPLALAFIQPVVDILPGPGYAMAGLALTATHQIILQSTSLQAWALTAPRTDLLSQNREGLTSSAGYMAIFLLGMSTGSVVLPRDASSTSNNGIVPKLLDIIGLKPGPHTPPSRAADIARLRLLLTLAGSCLFYSALVAAHLVPHLLPQLSTPISRRLANTPYVLWVAAFNTGQIALYCLIESVWFPGVRQVRTISAERQEAKRATSRALDDFNGSGLAIFLVANLLTGQVNMHLDTLRMGRAASMGVLIGYLLLLTGLARGLKGVKLKI